MDCAYVDFDVSSSNPPACFPPAGVYTFGLFTVDIFVNAGQVVTGNLAPYFLTVCKPNYTALGCQQSLRYISHQEACTGNQDDILRARKTFPSKEAALSVYAALYLAVSDSLLLRIMPLRKIVTKDLTVLSMSRYCSIAVSFDGLTKGFSAQKVNFLPAAVKQSRGKCFLF